MGQFELSDPEKDNIMTIFMDGEWWEVFIVLNFEQKGRISLACILHKTCKLSSICFTENRKSMVVSKNPSLESFTFVN